MGKDKGKPKRQKSLSKLQPKSLLALRKVR